MQIKDPLILQPGELRHQVGFARASATQDASGQKLNTWTPYLATRAKIENLSGQQLFQAAEFTSQASWRITLRFPGSGVIDVGDRATFAAHTFVVQIVNNVLERNRVLQLTCVEIDGAS
jgi:SPP1 family predicted phage head-tail adaptor